MFISMIIEHALVSLHCSCLFCMCLQNTHSYRRINVGPTSADVSLAVSSLSRMLGRHALILSRLYIILQVIFN